MVQPTTLKRRHSIKGGNLLPLVRRIRDGTVPIQYARMVASTALENSQEEYLTSSFKELTGETLDEVLVMAEREISMTHRRLALHFAILMANESGAPKGQQLMEEEVGPSNPKVSRSDLEERISTLEKKKDVGMVNGLKKKVRLLALQKEPSEALLLLALDELSTKSREVSHGEADIFEELYRQASRHQGEISLADLCLPVINGHTSDLVSKALAKCLKSSKGSDKQDPPRRLSLPLQRHTLVCRLRVGLHFTRILWDMDTHILALHHIGHASGPGVAECHTAQGGLVCFVIAMNNR